MSQIVIVTAIGARDKPGIVAALTEAVYEVGGSLDDATMTRLHGAFATMLAAAMGEKPRAPQIAGAAFVAAGAVAMAWP